MSDYRLFLFGRFPERIIDFIKNCSSAAKDIIVSDFTGLDKFHYDAIINCVGLGDPEKIRKVGADIFAITETYDNLVLKVLKFDPWPLYINFSSGAVYGRVFEQSAEESTPTRIDINHIGAEDYYAIAKINSEAKHRANAQWNIVDLRVFSYFSRYIDLASNLLISEIIRCVVEKKPFITSSSNIIRDYVHPSDLFSLVEKCIEKRRLNDVFDVYSLQPVSKLELLELFKKQYDLRIVIKEDTQAANATGRKDAYFSVNRRAEDIEYWPVHSSLSTIKEEAEALLNMK
jgi:nucleoside-diphosphate-sugar epimerase